METVTQTKKELTILKEASSEIQRVLTEDKNRVKGNIKSAISVVKYIITALFLWCGIVGFMILANELLKILNS
tara:strand:- start:321 stop:539 length:219 start_codon:yes stop_codon:yes gene_type:complete